MNKANEMTTQTKKIFQIIAYQEGDAWSCKKQTPSCQNRAYEREKSNKKPYNASQLPEFEQTYSLPMGVIKDKVMN